MGGGGGVDRQKETGRKNGQERWVGGKGRRGATGLRTGRHRPKAHSSLPLPTHSPPYAHLPTLPVPSLHPPRPPLPHPPPPPPFDSPTSPLHAYHAKPTLTQSSAQSGSCSSLEALCVGGDGWGGVARRAGEVVPCCDGGHWQAGSVTAHMRLGSPTPQPEPTCTVACTDSGRW